MGAGEITSLSSGSVQLIEHDLMGMDASALALARFLADVEPPFTIGLQGHWGSGKSSLVKMTKSLFEQNARKDSASSYWRNFGRKKGDSDRQRRSEGRALSDEIEKFRAAYAGKIDIIEFNPWADSELVRGARISSVLIERFIRALRETRFIDGAFARSLLFRIGRPAARLTIGSLFGMFVRSGGQPDQEMQMSPMSASLDEAIYSDSLRNELSARLRKPELAGRKIVFIIDDLDRVEPEQAVAMLDVITTLLDMPRCLFLVALDQDVLMPGIERKFGSAIAARNYFDKVLNISIQVRHSLTDRNLQGLVSKSIHFGDTDIQIPKQVQPIITQCAFENPRALKRLMWLAHFRQLESRRSKIGRKSYDGDTKGGAFDELAAALASVEDAYPVFHRLIFNSGASDPGYWKAVLGALEIGLAPQEDEARLDQEPSPEMRRKRARIDAALAEPVARFEDLDPEEKRERDEKAKGVIIQQFVTILQKIVASDDEAAEPADPGRTIEHHYTEYKRRSSEARGSVYDNRRSSGWMATYLSSSLLDFRKRFGRDYSYPQVIERYMAKSWSFSSVMVHSYAGFLKNHINAFHIFVGATAMEIWVDLADGENLGELAEIVDTPYDDGTSASSIMLGIGRQPGGIVGGPWPDEKYQPEVPQQGHTCIHRWEFDRPLESNQQFEQMYDKVLARAVRVIEYSVDKLGPRDTQE